jgi:hypothetical protein
VRSTPYWSSLSFSAVLTVRFQIDFPALAARLAFLYSSLEPTMRFPSLPHDLEYKSLLAALNDVQSKDFIFDLYALDRDALRCLFVSRFHIIFVPFLANVVQLAASVRNRCLRGPKDQDTQPLRGQTFSLRLTRYLIPEVGGRCGLRKKFLKSP